MDGTYAPKGAMHTLSEGVARCGMRTNATPHAPRPHGGGGALADVHMNVAEPVCGTHPAQ